MSVSTEKADFLIIGGGVAGLRAAIELARKGKVLVLTKDNPAESSTGYAQGGIAVALSDEDEVGIHYKDTIKAGNGLCREEAVKALVEEGPDLIRELISWGAQFDKEGSRLAFTKEAAHSRKRILHAQGDSTGRELERVLINKARSFSSVSRYAFAFTMDLIIADGRCIGAVVLKNRELISIYAKAVVLATGGAGQLYSRTTNPLIATGDGMAIAYRAGALLEDMEFVQFHPTTLYSPSAPQFLLSEAMRGEGAILKNIRGRRFMPHYHKMAELAPRDIVTRAIISEMVRTKAKHVYLDLRHLDRDFVKKRFPRIYSTCLKFDIDITEDLIPVSPAAHYIMGGVKSNLNGETNIRGLFVAGEVACTGVHGANRLASNSLLEGLVYGARAGRTAAAELRVKSEELKEKGLSDSSFRHFATQNDTNNLQSQNSGLRTQNIDIEKIRNSLRRLMWNKAGIIRCGESLDTAKAWLKKHDFITGLNFSGRAELELKNMLTVANLIVDSALLRQGSAGAHYRTDFKEKGKGWRRHSICQKGKTPWWGNDKQLVEKVLLPSLRTK